MKPVVHKVLPTLLAMILCTIFAVVLTIYINPMADVSLDLSLIPPDNSEAVDPAAFDSKGWTVYTCEEGVVTELEPDGFGGYLGLEPGQTFYFSRVLNEELDSPTLQLGTVNRTFSVWLNDTLIYTDCPELDNRIGYLHLPMREWDSTTPTIISLPLDYQGKTLTIAQSCPEYSEGGSFKAYPADVVLYCGYAYESGLISESFGVAIVAAIAFVIGVLFIIAFVRTGDWGLLVLSLAAFLWMTMHLADASFFWKYFGTHDNSPLSAAPLFPVTVLFFFLTSRGGRYKKFLGILAGICTLSVILYAALLYLLPAFTPDLHFSFFIIKVLPYWLAFISIITVLVLGLLFWRKESWFYRVFTPTALAGMVIYWLAIIFFVEPGIVGEQIIQSLKTGQMNYIYYRTVPIFTISALAVAIIEAAKNEFARHAEKLLLEERRQLTLQSYDTIRRQHEEVMMLRHDMNKHFRALQEISDQDHIKAYLNELIGQNEKIRPVVQSGNEMLDIILNSKLSAAVDAGIHLEIQRVQAPAKLPLTDTDLCSLIMNLIDNAITAASAAKSPFIRLDIHTKDNFFSFTCENSADAQTPIKKSQKNTLASHGLGLKIAHQITERYEGLINTEPTQTSYKVHLLIPLF